MAVALDYVITEAQKNEVNVASRPTVLRGTAEENKQAFDGYCDLIRTRFNGLCGYIDGAISTEVVLSVRTQYLALGCTFDD